MYVYMSGKQWLSLGRNLRTEGRRGFCGGWVWLVDWVGDFFVPYLRYVHVLIKNKKV